MPSLAPEVLSLYGDAPPAVRAHLALRWATCPFERVAAQVPSGGRVLEVGCGYGLFSNHLALSSPKRQVMGIDIDVRKVVHGQRAAQRGRARGAACEVHLEPPGEVPGGPWDAIVIVDVLYLLDVDAQEGLLRSCAEALALGGVLVVKEMARTPRWKARWNTAQETLAVRVLRITAGDELTFLRPEVLGGWMEAGGLAVTHEDVSRGYPHPHHLMTATRTPGVRAVTPSEG